MIDRFESFTTREGAEHLTNQALLGIVVDAVKRGSYPSDGAFYYVAAVGALSGTYLSLPAAINAADERQALANQLGGLTQFEVRTKDRDIVIYRPLSTTNAQSHGKAATTR